MASYDDDYNGDSPFGPTFGNFPYYAPIPAAVGGSVSAILANFGSVPGLNTLAGWTKEQVALFGCLGAVRS